MKLKTKLSQLQSKYPKTMVFVEVIIILIIMGIVYEFGKTFGEDIYNLFH